MNNTLKQTNVELAVDLFIAFPTLVTSIKQARSLADQQAQHKALTIINKIGIANRYNKPTKQLVGSLNLCFA